MGAETVGCGGAGGDGGGIGIGVVEVVGEVGGGFKD